MEFETGLLVKTNLFLLTWIRLKISYIGRHLWGIDMGEEGRVGARKGRVGFDSGLTKPKSVLDDIKNATKTLI